jgi:hypothetical protein
MIALAVFLLIAIVLGAVFIKKRFLNIAKRRGDEE